jgi:hypothetical protein
LALVDFFARFFAAIAIGSCHSDPGSLIEPKRHPLSGTRKESGPTALFHNVSTCCPQRQCAI